jgi:hypothetical protein
MDPDGSPGQKQLLTLNGAPLLVNENLAKGLRRGTTTWRIAPHLDRRSLH